MLAAITEWGLSFCVFGVGEEGSSVPNLIIPFLLFSFFFSLDDDLILD